MTRPGWCAFVLLATAAASPHPSLPIPPIPPAHPPADEAAPMPDPDLRPPAGEIRSGPQIKLQDFRQGREDQSLGYSPGSHFRTSEDKRVIQTPGLSVQVPLR
jgi:hypothetical protein